MKVKELIKKINLTLTTKPDFEDKEITSCYICDLLSRVMSKAQSGNIWATIQSNVNIVAVALLAECSCIILCEGIQPDKDAIDKANENDVIILTTDKTSYELACNLYEVL